MGTHQPIRKIVTPATPEIPDKLYFRIGDVSKLCALPAYVLRFWETEFPQLKPHKGGTGQRLYRKRDVEMVLRIKSLLYDQGYTIPGARQVFKSEAKPGSPEAAIAGSFAEAQPAREPVTNLQRETQLQALRNELTAILGILSSPIQAAETHGAETDKIKTMRPRLVPERNPKPVPAPAPTLISLKQPGLFGDEPAEPA